MDYVYDLRLCVVRVYWMKGRPFEVWGFSSAKGRPFQSVYWTKVPGSVLNFRCKSAVIRSLPCTLSSQTGRQTVDTVHSRFRKLKSWGNLAKSGSSSLRIIHVYRTYHTKRKANMVSKFYLSFGNLEWNPKLERGGSFIFLEVWSFAELKPQTWKVDLSSNTRYYYRYTYLAGYDQL